MTILQYHNMNNKERKLFRKIGKIMNCDLKYKCRLRENVMKKGNRTVTKKGVKG